VLQAVHLFLAFRLFVIVVGVDTRWMETSLETVLDKLVSKENGATPRDYLEKIFQIPYWTRSMDGDASQRFVSGLLESIKSAEPEDGASGGPPDDTIPPVDPISPEEGSGIYQEASEEDIDWEEAEEDESLDEGMDEEAKDDNGTLVETKAVTPHIYSPVSLTEEEKAFMRKVAIYAGDTPRQALRFVNVYGLVKSVLEEPETRERLQLQDQKIDHEALIGQLAIATGTRKLGRKYFDAASGTTEQLTEFLIKLHEHLKNNSPDVRFDAHIIFSIIAILNNFENTYADFFNMNKGRELHIAMSVLSATTHERIHATAPIARRYTFAS
jgi:hypothetical protein